MSSRRGKDAQRDDRMTLTIAYVITAAWAISFLVDIVVPEYEPSASVHALMMIVAGATFGEGLLRTRPPKENRDQDPEN